MTLYEEKLSDLKTICFSNDKQVQTVIFTRNFIDRNFDKNLNLEFLSEIGFTSKFHLQRLFKRYYGLTPKQYLVNKRIEKSKEFLVMGLTITETCFTVGFVSLGSFSKLFKTKTGKSPTEFQKEQVSRSN